MLFEPPFRARRAWLVAGGVDVAMAQNAQIAERAGTHDLGRLARAVCEPVARRAARRFQIAARRNQRTHLVRVHGDRLLRQQMLALRQRLHAHLKPVARRKRQHDQLHIRVVKQLLAAFIHRRRFETLLGARSVRLDQIRRRRQFQPRRRVRYAHMVRPDDAAPDHAYFHRFHSMLLVCFQQLPPDPTGRILMRVQRFRLHFDAVSRIAGRHIPPVFELNGVFKMLMQMLNILNDAVAQGA